MTFTASWHKIFDPNPRIGFLAQARVLAAGPATSASARLIFNNRLDAAVTGVLVVMVALVLIESAAPMDWSYKRKGRGARKRDAVCNDASCGGERMNGIVKAARIVVATLREIFDEAAYDRFLRRTQMASSRAAYAAFRQESEDAKQATTQVLLSASTDCVFS